MAIVNLHIGLMKSGTSYLQEILSSNKDILRQQGVLFPGARWRAQKLAAEDAVGFSFRGRTNPGAWEGLANEVRGHDGDISVISMEFLSFSDERAARSIIDSFPEHHVRVIVTARDLARVIPSAWQQSIKGGATKGIDKYLALISAPGARSIHGARSFWGPQDLGRILRTWKPLVEPEDVVLVTIPPGGSPPALLWERFSAAAGLPTFDAHLPAAINESLGDASTEVLRRLNRRADQQGLPAEVTKPLRRIFAARANQESPLSVPEAYRPWATKMAEQLVQEVEQLDIQVVGELRELLVTQWGDTDASTSRLRALRSRSHGTTRTQGSEDELMDAALDAILGLALLLPNKQNKRGASQ